MEVSPSCDLLTWPHGAQGMPRSHALPPSGARSALHDLAAVRMQHLPAHVRGVVRSQEDEAVGHLVRLGGRSLRCLWPLMYAALDADLPLLMPRWHGLPLRHAASSGLGSPLVLCVPHSQAATCVPDTQRNFLGDRQVDVDGSAVSWCVRVSGCVLDESSTTAERRNA